MCWVSAFELFRREEIPAYCGLKIVRIFYFIYYDNKRMMKMKKAGISFEEIKNDMLKDEEFRAEYVKLKPRYEAIEQIIKARKEQNITQSELAKRVGTQKSNISRLESGNYNPSLDFLVKVAESLGKDLIVQIK